MLQNQQELLLWVLLEQLLQQPQPKALKKMQMQRFP
jgi:hypothetical protein